MIKQTYEQWKLNNNEDSRNILVATIIYCIIILLFKFFILAPIKNNFKKTPSKKTQIEKAVKITQEPFIKDYTNSYL